MTGRLRSARACCSCPRELTPSLVNTLRRCHSTVRVLRSCLGAGIAGPGVRGVSVVAHGKSVLSRHQQIAARSCPPRRAWADGATQMPQFDGQRRRAAAAASRYRGIAGYSAVQRHVPVYVLYRDIRVIDERGRSAVRAPLSRGCLWSGSFRASAGGGPGTAFLICQSTRPARN